MAETITAAPKAKPKSTTFSKEIVAAILRADTHSTGYATTESSEHATCVNKGTVRVELPHAENGRRTVTVRVPDTFEFEVVE